MESCAGSGARPPLGLKILGFEQHVAEVAKRGQRKQQQGNHHGRKWGLDVVEKVNRAAKEPEAGQAGGREERGNKEGRHEKKGGRKYRRTIGGSQLPVARQSQAPT
jgi:hypothetical protein